MSWVVSVADAGCMTIGVSAASEKQAHVCSSCEGGALPSGLRGLPSARVAPKDTVLCDYALSPGHSSGVTGQRGEAICAPPPNTAFLSRLRSPPALGPSPPAGSRGTSAASDRGWDSPARLLLPQVSTFTPQQSQRPPQTLRHRVSALLFDKTGRHGSGPSPARPAPLSGPRRALTPLVRLQLCFQVLGGHVEACVLARGGPGLAPPAAAVEAAAEAAAAVAAGEEPAYDKQRLRGRTTGRWPCSLRTPTPRPARAAPRALWGRARPRCPSRAEVRGLRETELCSFQKGSLQRAPRGLTGQHRRARWPGPVTPWGLQGTRVLNQIMKSTGVQKQNRRNVKIFRVSFQMTTTETSVRNTLGKLPCEACPCGNLLVRERKLGVGWLCAPGLLHTG